jgi:aspartyl-tRNA(Asn)/glutamyl-tRNA(Gln) amidotransferase subunit A
MSSQSDPCLFPASRLALEIASKRLSAVEVVDAFLNRIAAHDGKLNAYVEVYEKQARLAAEAADKAILSGHAVGPYHGVPIALKDLIELEGRVTSAGSAEFHNRRAKTTAVLAKRLISNGLIILGKTQTAEFAYSGWGINEHLGTPWNPWDVATLRTPGGSSSGSGVATAACLAPWTIGTDTGGSVRLPASFCGLTALKTTIGRVTSEGILPLSQSLDTPGPIARSVADAAILFELIRDRGTREFGTDIAGLRPPLGNTKSIKGLKLGRIPEAERHGVDLEVLRAYDRSLVVFAELGAEIVDIKLPFCFADVRPTQMTILHAEAYANYHAVIDDESSMLDSSVRAGIGRGRTISAAEYLFALEDQKRLQRAMLIAMGDLHAILTPTTETAALDVKTVDNTTTPARFTRFANTLGMCALALPNGKSSAGLPLSLQIVCRAREEPLALKLGQAFQDATEWHTYLPDLAGFARTSLDLR